MKLYRYMSMQELVRLSAGMDLVNANEHRYSKTNSNGFCFLPEVLDIHEIGGHSNADGSAHSYEAPATYAGLFLSGIVSEDVLVEFEASDMSMFQKGYGIYADPQSSYYDDLLRITEYSTRFYNRDVLKPLRYCIPKMQCQEKWYPWH